ncbi:hypothetical protein GCM10027162_25870 [Streptomyces incanus]
MLNSMWRGLAAASLAVLPLAVSAPAHAAQKVPLAEAVAQLPVSAESRDGYDRDLFRALSRYWVRDCLMARWGVVGPRPGPVVRPWWAGWQRR